MKAPIFIYFTISLLISALGVFSCVPSSRYHADQTENGYFPTFLHPPQKESNNQLDTPLSLSDIIHLIRKNNPDIMAADEKIQYTKALLKEAQSGFYPYIGIYSEYIQGDSPSGYLFKSIDRRDLPAATNFNDPGWFENYESGLMASFSLFNGGRDVMGQRIAQNNVRVSQLDHQEILNTVIAETIKLYYDTLAAESFVETVETSVETVASQLAVTTIRYESGGALKSDLLSLKFRLAQAKENLVRSRNLHRILSASLLNMLGISPDRAVQLKKENISLTNLPNDYESAFKSALSNHPRIEKIKKELINARMAVDIASLSRLPQLDLKAKYYADDDTIILDTEEENWTAGLFLTFDLFTGFKKTAAKEKQVALLRETMAIHKKTILEIQYELKKSYLNLNDANERLLVSEKNVETAKETFHIVKQQYEGGSADITRYLEAELSVSQAQFSATNAFFDKQKAYAEIGRATGIIQQLFN